MSLRQDGFPRADRYAQLDFRPPGRVLRERGPGTPAWPFTERHLQCVWYDDALRPATLTTSDGEALVVQAPGRWNLEAGPDFRDATLVVGSGQRRLQGDVEIHIHPDDWRQHGHAPDPRYARVVAHVTYFPGALPAADLPPGAVQCALRPALTAQPAFSFEAIDVTAYPYAACPTAPHRCTDVLGPLPPDAREALLDAAGEERLRRKAARCAALIGERPASDVFFEEVCAALGYKHNRTAFRTLAHLLPYPALRAAAGGDVLTACALLLGTAGLLPATVSARWDDETRAFVRALWDRWWKQAGSRDQTVMQKTDWRLAGLRPANHPVRRIAAAAGIFTQPGDPLEALDALDPRDPAAWFRQAALALTAAARVPYWTTHLAFASPRLARPVELLGADRAAAVLTNVVIPLLAARGRAVAPLLDHLPAEQDSGPIREAAHLLFGRDHNPALYHTGLRQQGLLQIFLDFCLNRRNGCADCALARALTDYARTPDRADPANSLAAVRAAR